MRLKFKQVDVFTDRPFRGNPVAVVLGADALSGDEMQHIAGWTNLSETTFALAPTAPGADYRLRIFTPRAELPFAGHPTVGSAHALVEAGIVLPKDGHLRQQCGAGVLDLTVDGERVWVKAPEPKVTKLDARYADNLGAALGARVAGSPQVVNVGPVWLVADLGDASQVDALDPDMQALSGMSEPLGITGVTVFGASSAGDCAIHVRSFAPAHGVPEDPVCGSGNVSVAAYLSRTGQIQRHGERYEARQGMQLGRDGRVSVRIGDGGRSIEIGGRSVTSVEGTIRVR